MDNHDMGNCGAVLWKHSGRLCVAGMVAIFAVSSATAASTPDKSRETPGRAAFQAQHGGFKRDRKITRHIVRHERINHANLKHAH
jgi:hypothetical protein